MLQKIFRAKSGGFFLSKNDSQTLDLTNSVSIGLDRHYADLYPQHYYKFDPFLAALPSHKPILTVSDLMPYHDWINLEYYRICLRPQKIHHQLAIYLYSGTRLLGSIALHRPKEAPEFSERETMIAHVLAPCLTAALENTQILTQLKTEIDLYREMDELSSKGIIVLDNELRLLYRNGKAKALCLSILHKQKCQAGEAEREQPPLPSEILHDCLSLKRILQDRDQEQITVFKPTRIMYGEHNEVLKITTFPSRQFYEGISSPRFLIRIEDLSKIDNTREEALKKEYHLTDREIEIICLVCEGLTNEEIGEKLCISRFTVYTHMKNIFEKMGVKHRTELASCGLGQQHWYTSEMDTLSS